MVMGEEPLASRLTELDMKSGHGLGCHGEGIPLPEDLLVDGVLVRLECGLVCMLGQCCRRLRAITSDEKLWQRLACKNLGHACAQVTSSKNWRRACMELSTLRQMCWERKLAPQEGIVSGGRAWPRGRWGHTVTVLDKDTFMIFGGECAGATNDVRAGATNDVHVYNCAKAEWSKMRCEGTYPRERFGHACVLHAGAAVIFGGSDGHEYFDDLHCLDVIKWRFWKPRTSGAPPEARSSHSMTLLGHHAFVFGGVGSVRTADGAISAQLPTRFVTLDVNNWTWHHPDVGGTIPDARFVHRMAPFHDRMLLFGGRTMRSENGKFNDLHWFDAKSLSWEKVSEVTGDVPPERGGCSFLTLGRNVIVFGGRAQNDVCLMDGIYILHTDEEPMRWQRVEAMGMRKGARTPEIEEPSPRGAHGFGYINGKVVVFGGYGPPKDGVTGDEAVEQPLDDLFFLHLKWEEEDTDHVGEGEGAAEEATRPLSVGVSMPQAVTLEATAAVQHASYRGLPM